MKILWKWTAENLFSKRKLSAWKKRKIPVSHLPKPRMSISGGPSSSTLPTPPRPKGGKAVLNADGLGAQGKGTCVPLVSSGGTPQVKDTGHNGMESIDICCPVWTLSIFLVREIRTDNHPPTHTPPTGLPAQTHPPKSDPGSWHNTGPPVPSTNLGLWGKRRRRRK